MKHTHTAWVRCQDRDDDGRLYYSTWLKYGSGPSEAAVWQQLALDFSGGEGMPSMLVLPIGVRPLLKETV